MAYRLVFTGRVRDGERSEDVIDKLAKLLRADSQQCDQLKRGDSIIIKSDLTLDDAQMRKSVIDEKTGAACEIEPMPRAEDIPAAVSSDIQTRQCISSEPSHLHKEASSSIPGQDESKRAPQSGPDEWPLLEEEPGFVSHAAIQEQPTNQSEPGHSHKEASSNIPEQAKGPSLSVVFYWLAALGFVGSLKLCNELWPDRYSDPNMVAYLPSIIWLVAGVVQGALFWAIGLALSYLKTIAENSTTWQKRD